MKSYDDSDWCQMFAHWFKMVTIVAIVLVGFATPVSAAHFGFGTFELEGDLNDSNPTDMVDDWQGPPTHAFSTTYDEVAQTRLLHDGKNMSIFVGGGSKDIRDVSQWKWKHGSVPDKDDIENAYAAAYRVSGDAGDELHVFLAGDRFSTDGSAQMGVWFFQEKVGMDPDGTFTGKHTDGDILMLAEFTEGGRAGNIKLYAWDTSQKINLRLLNVDSTDDAETFYALSNGDYTESWADMKYTPKGGTAGDMFPPNSFFEGGINLSYFLGDQIPCFSSFLMETRSSHRVNAQLKDFVLGELNTCKLEITNMCISSKVQTVDYVTLDNVFKYEISNVGFGELSNISLESTHLGYIDTVSVSSGGVFSDTYDYSDIQNPAKDAVTATYNNGSASVTSNVAECPEVIQTFAMSLEKQCTTYLVDKDGHVAVEVGYEINVCNDQNGSLLTNVNVYDPTAGVSVTYDNLYPANDPRLNTSEEFEQCKTITGTYLSTSNTVIQTNLVRVDANGSLNGSVSATKEAECSLCPKPE